MHIAIDAHSVGTGLAGNETYAANLIEALAEIDQRNRYTLYVTKQAAIERFANRWTHVTVRRTLPHMPLVRIPVTLSAELRRRRVDLLHVQFTAPPFAPCPVVATIHDLSFEHFPETFKRRSCVQLRFTVRRTAQSARHIITSSEYSRRDIVETYKLSPERVTVTPLAAAHHFAPVEDAAELARVRACYKLPAEYILAVGSIQPRKNLPRLIQAYERLCESRPQGTLPQLVLVGNQAWLSGDTLNAIARTPHRERIILTGYVPESDLPALYTAALCFVYPSFFEGFGLPPLEAMRCGAPVLTGDRSSLPEVVGDAGLTFNPFDEQSITETLARIVNNANLRAELRAKGFEQARRFDWRETARRTLAVYEKVKVEK